MAGGGSFQAFERSLQLRGIRFEDLRKAAQGASFGGREAQIFAFGSLVEGYANSASDIDLCEIGADESRSREHGKKRTIQSDDLTLDLLYLDRQQISRLVGRLRSQPYSPVRFRDLATLFSAAERRFLYIVATGVPLVGESPSLIVSPALSRAEVATQGLACARYYLHNSQVDLVGMLTVGDFVSAHLVLLSLLGNLADLIAAVHGEFDPVEKWRMRKLAKLPLRWHDLLAGPGPSEPADRIFRALHLAAAEFLRSRETQGIYQALALARQTLIGADLAFEGRAGGCRIECAWRSDAKSYDPMPNLRIDAAIFIADGSARVVALAEPQRSFYCSADEVALLTLFDGRFSRIEAHDWAAEIDPAHGFRLLQDLECSARDAGLLVPPATVGPTA